jgi:hypothetical protein
MSSLGLVNLKFTNDWERLAAQGEAFILFYFFYSIFLLAEVLLLKASKKKKIYAQFGLRSFEAAAPVQFAQNFSVRCVSVSKALNNITTLTSQTCMVVVPTLEVMRTTLVMIHHRNSVACEFGRWNNEHHPL